MIVFYAICLFNLVESARILSVQHVASYSHYTLLNALGKELARRGHEVTVITAFPEKNPAKNVRTILLTGAIEQLQGSLSNVVEAATQNAFIKNIHYEMMGLNVSEETLRHPNVQALLKSDEKFDLILLEQFLDDSLRGLCYYYNAHCITVSTVLAGRWSNPYVGNSGPPSVVPDVLVDYSSKMNFYQRLHNTIVYFGCYFMSQFYFIPKHNEILQKYFPEAPHINELIYNTSLILVNSHVSIHFPMSFVPNMIDVGGFHVQPPKALPKNMQTFMDEAKDGVIYFSMGAYLRTNLLPKGIKEQLLEVFSKLKQRVFMKWHNDSVGTIPPNVFVGDWLPQGDILAHPNMKVLITHGGLLSTIEAIYHGVPLLGIPVFADQLLNIMNCASLGYAEGLPLTQFTKDKFEMKLKEILQNPKYTENVKERSRIFHNRPMKPLDTAMFWIEYVLKHNGADHLKTSTLYLSWYQYYLLDVFAALILAICAIFAVIFVSLRRLFCKQERKMTETKKNN